MGKFGHAGRDKRSESPCPEVNLIGDMADMDEAHAAQAKDMTTPPCNSTSCTNRRYAEAWVREGDGYWILDLNIPENIERYSRCPPVIHDGSLAHDELHKHNVKSSGAIWYHETHPYVTPNIARTEA